MINLYTDKNLLGILLYYIFMVFERVKIVLLTIKNIESCNDL